jgi:carboxylesterase
MEIKRPLPFISLDACVGPLSQWAEHVPRGSLPIRHAELRKQAEASRFIGTFNLRAVQSALELIRDVKQIVRHIKNPTLIIQSPHDQVVDPRGAHFLMEHLGSLQKSVHWLKASDHVITLDAEQEEVFAKVLDFLRP